ncbi:helix-turn-helix transcriptional regulator [Candidatus Saccharibacteria bacterium]|nr:helix-turn-helix transcriptional regulator [Candidatus Saccharibacteria bacterium]
MTKTYPEVAAQFGQRLRKIRESKGISQEKLANESGLDRTYVSGIERGRRNPSLINISKLAKGLNVKITDLFN